LRVVRIKIIIPKIIINGYNVAGRQDDNYSARDFRWQISQTCTPLRSCQGDLSSFIKSRPFHLSQRRYNRLLPFDPPSPIHTYLSYPPLFVTILNNMAQATTNTQSATGSDRPERSRNAKAQARHRAKRKAYIEQVHNICQRPLRLLDVLVLTLHFYYHSFYVYTHICIHSSSRP
jgi:hypothetical protein